MEQSVRSEIGKIDQLHLCTVDKNTVLFHASGGSHDSKTTSGARSMLMDVQVTNSTLSQQQRGRNHSP